MNIEELSKAAKILIDEHGITPEVITEALAEAYTSAYKRSNEGADNVEVSVDLENANIELVQVKEVIPDDGPIDEVTEIRLSDARALDVPSASAYEEGDIIKFAVDTNEFGRYAAQSAKNRFLQLIREAEKQIIMDEYVEQEHEIVTARVSRGDAKFIWVTLPGGQEVSMGERDLISGETFELGQNIKVLITGVNVDAKSGNPTIHVSRSDSEFVKRLFEQEVPEVYDGTVVIESIAREAGERSKVAVRTVDPNIDPIGALVGPQGSRVQAVIREVNGEKMDIIEWVEDEAQFIANALNPSEVLDVVFDPSREDRVTVIVPDHQLSLAIGKRGQNARLTAKLTGFKIDIKTATEAQNDEQLQAIISQAAQFAEDEDVYYEGAIDIDNQEEVQEGLINEEENAAQLAETADELDPDATAEFEAALNNLQDDTQIDDEGEADEEDVD